MGRAFPFARHDKADVSDAQRVVALALACPPEGQESALVPGPTSSQVGRVAVRGSVDDLVSRLRAILAFIMDPRDKGTAERGREGHPLQRTT